MRRLARFAVIPVIATVAACSGAETDSVVDASLERDLRLASTMSLALPPAAQDHELALETAPPAAETPAPKPRRAPTGKRIVRAERPTVAAAPTIEHASGTEAESVLETITQPTESVAESESGDVEAAPLPRPTPVSIEGAGQESGGWGGGTGSRGRGEGDGGWGGVVIRGGDIDDCRIEPRRGGGVPVIFRRPGGGVATGRWPTGAERPQGRTGGAEGRRGGRWPIASSGGSSRTSGSARSGSGSVWGRRG